MCAILCHRGLHINVESNNNNNNDRGEKRDCNTLL